MSLDSRKLLARNLADFMQKSPDLKTQGALHRKSTVAQATIGRILRCEVDATVDTVDKLARAFGLDGWILLHPKPDLKAHEGEFYAKLRKLLNEVNGRS